MNLQRFKSGTFNQDCLISNCYNITGFKTRKQFYSYILR